MASGVFPTYMDCHDFMHQIDAFIDGELEINEHSLMEAHSGACAECNEKEARRRNTRQRLRATANAFQPSSDFMARLQSAIEEKSASVSHALREEQLQKAQAVHAEPPAQQRPEPAVVAAFDETVARRSRADFVRRNWKVFALAAVALVALSFGLRSDNAKHTDDKALVAGYASFASPVVGESVAWHRRSVPVEVVGPDATTVRRWFSDKVSFAVNIPEFDRPARLLGGRLSHVRQYEAAYLLYEVNGSKLSVMLFDAGELSNEADFKTKTFVDNSNGYNVAIREKSGVTYTFTSDMNAEELAELVDGTMN